MFFFLTNFKAGAEILAPFSSKESQDLHPELLFPRSRLRKPIFADVAKVRVIDDISSQSLNLYQGVSQINKGQLDFLIA